MMKQNSKKTVRIGNASGFWGDDPLALKRQLAYGNLDFVNADYLAEVSMSILSKQMAKDPSLGYVPDFIDHVQAAQDYLQKSTSKIITNAGGSNPVGCARKLAQVLRDLGIKKKIIAITGDNLVEEIATLYNEGVKFRNLETGDSFATIRKRVVAANAYTGSLPIVEALQQEADIVITGRAADSALTIAPLVYAFKWDWKDYDMIAGGMTAGHILECGAQATGGNFTDWHQIKQWTPMGFPIIEMQADGIFYVTKNEQEGGLVNSWTVKEQLVYEIADPSHYYGPDVTADFSSLQIEDISEDRVRVTGAKGTPPPSDLKVSMAYSSGFKAQGSVIISGPEAIKKAETFTRIFWEGLSCSFEKKAANYIGYNATHQHLAPDIVPNEIMLQLVAFDHNKENLELFARNLSSLILSGPQGIAVIGGRPKIQNVIRYWPALVPRKYIQFKVIGLDKNGDQQILKELNELDIYVENKRKKLSYENKKTNTGTYYYNMDYDHAEEINITTRLSKFCLARSGDKGNTVNIGVLARNGEVYEFLKNWLTSGLVKNWFQSICKGKVTRYELDNIWALNFVLTDALDGGGTYSGRIDTQGKTLATAFLNQTMEVPESILNSLTRKSEDLKNRMP